MRVSPLVDSCDRLIFKKAAKTYNRLSPENQRWIDFEDVIQDGFIEAWQAEQRYRQDFGTKYSTYLYRGLDLLFHGRYHAPLQQQKRVARLKELDAPVPGSEDTFPDLVSQEPTPEEIFSAVSGVLQVCHALPPDAVSFLLQVVTTETGQITRRGSNSIVLIPEACQRYDVRREDLALIMVSAYAKSMLVEGVVAAAGHLGEDDAKVLECINCRASFSLNDARKGRYSATSLTCLTCLRELHASGPELTCFGRRKVVKGKTVVEGYSEADTECRMHCRDRVACRQFIEKGEKRMTTGNVENIELETEGIDFTDIETGDIEVPASPEAAPATKPRKAAAKRAAKPAKVVEPEPVAAEPEAPVKKAVKAAPKKAAKKAAPKKAAKKPVQRSKKSTAKIDPKEAKKQGLIKLDEQGRDLPFKPGSVMRYYLTEAMEPGGTTEAALEKFASKNGYNHKFQMAVLLSGKSGDSGRRPYPSTHTWKVERDEKTGKIQVYNVRRIAFYARMDRV